MISSNLIHLEYIEITIDKGNLILMNPNHDELLISSLPQKERVSH